MTAALLSTHDTLADWLFLIAAIVFAVVALVALTNRPDPTRGFLMPIGLALVAAGLLVL